MAHIAKALVFAGNGINCEYETANACKKAGFEQVDIVTVWELLHGDVALADYHFLNLPGGFLDGDDLGSAKAHANRLQHATIATTGERLFEQLQCFIADGKLILGICNGFQLMVKLGLLPALGGAYGTQQVTLTNNDSGKFEDRWVWVRANPASPCVFTAGMGTVYLPVRHGEGKFIAQDSATLQSLQRDNLVVFTYLDTQDGSPTMDYPANPNGSQGAIAALCDASGRVMGLMPHPEAYVSRTNHPRWTREELPEEGMGLALFRNAYRYVKQNL
jgi:phosphoribosylformylglycinamidine synthase